MQTLSECAIHLPSIYGAPTHLGRSSHVGYAGGTQQTAWTCHVASPLNYNIFHGGKRQAHD